MGNTRLHSISASKSGEDALVALVYLVNHGLRRFLNTRNNQGHTAVVLAACERNWNIVQYMIAAGADVLKVSVILLIIVDYY